MNITAFKKLTRIEQTLFGLPFVLGGALLPITQMEVSFSFRWLWIFPAFMLARISGMAFNQLIDHKIDAKNLRTEKRVIPRGLVSAKEGGIVAWGSLLLFLLVCLQINKLCFLMASFAAFLLFIYSYLKRFTASCHFVLGIIHFLGPVMASVAISGSLLIAPLFLGLAAALSIIANDIAYAIQDFDFDKIEDLHSLPSRIGIERSLLVARIAHIGSLFALLFLGIVAYLPVFYFLLLPIAALIFYRFHNALRQKMIEPLFFSCNVVISFTVFTFILASVIWDAM